MTVTDYLESLLDEEKISEEEKERIREKSDEVEIALRLTNITVDRIAIGSSKNYQKHKKIIEELRSCDAVVDITGEHAFKYLMMMF